MYCKNCGKVVDEGSLYCKGCGIYIDSPKPQNNYNDHSSFGFAVLGFFIPLVGLILFLVYERKEPKRAKSAGKGALIGFITKFVLSIIFSILFIVLTPSIFSKISNGIESNVPAIGDIYSDEDTKQILEKYVDVSFGEFCVNDDKYLTETSLNINVKNKAEKRYTYFITIEAVDENGTRIDTDTIYADKLNAGQQINLTAFEYVDEDKIEQFKNAKFKVLDIKKYRF